VALSWIDFIDGATLASIRAKINGFNGSVETDVNANTTQTATNITDIATNVTDIADIVSGTTALAKWKLTPTVTPPSHVEGQMYYNDTHGTFNYQGPFSGIEVSPGHGLHVHVINNSGGTIEAGMVVRPNGISGGKMQVVKALADSFEHARVIGIAVQEIPNGQESAVATSGFVMDINTNGLPLGVPMYLSDTVAGTYTATAPAIRTQIGGVFVADATEGVIYTNLVNNQNVPSVFGGIAGQTGGDETYSLTTTAQDIDDYATDNTVVMTTSKGTGEITLSNDGTYRVHFTASMSFTSTTTTRSITFELYDVTNTAIHFSYTKNIPRNATEDAVSFSFPISEVADNVHKMRIKSNVAMDVTFNEVSFDIESVSIS